MQLKFYSQEEYTSSDLSELQIDTSGSFNCIIAHGTQYLSNPANLGIKAATCQTITNTKERYGICQYTECTASDGKLCIFPFKYILKTT